MVLTSKDIVSRIRSENQQERLSIVPQPNLDEIEKSGGASLDLRLGTWVLSMKQMNVEALAVGASADKWNEGRITRTRYVRFGDHFILHPHSFVLAATLEWIRLPRDLAGYVVGKSSQGRRGLIIATATGVHPGFVGCLTLEITNVGEVPLKLTPGMAICQLFLHATTDEAIVADQSFFVCFRRPVLGPATSDAFVTKLSGK